MGIVGVSLIILLII